MAQAPHSNKVVTPYIIPAPVGIDRVITALQESFTANLAWLSKSFGKAEITTTTEDDVEIVFPSVLTSASKDAIALIGNDNFAAYSFFTITEEATPIDWAEHVPNSLERQFDVIFWMDLKLVDSAKLYNYREELILEVEKVIRETSFTGIDGVEVLGIFEKTSDVYDGFSVDLVKTQLLEYPKTGFRIRMNAIYQTLENC